MNLLQLLPCLTKEDRRAIAYALRAHDPSGRWATDYVSHYQLACADVIGLLNRNRVIAALSKANRSRDTLFTPMRESTYVALSKLR
jgi:hypothetical protein